MVLEGWLARLARWAAWFLLAWLLLLLASGLYHPTRARQRRAAQDLLCDDADQMLSDVGLGRRSVAEVCEQARRLHAKHNASPAVAFMASLGASGVHSSNQERDLHRWLRTLDGLEVEPYWITLELEDGDRVVPTKVPTLPPHMVMHYLSCAGPQQFAVSMLGPDGPQALCEWWEAMRRIPGSRAHLVDPESCVPVLFHVDGAEVNNSEEVIWWSWRSAVTSGNVHDVKHLICGVPMAKMRQKAVRKRVLRDIAAFVAWSMQWAGQGIGPESGFAGGPLPPSYGNLAGRRLAGPMTMQFSGWCGDTKARVECHEFSRNFAATVVCDECCAVHPRHKDPELRFLSYYNASADAPWRATAISHEANVRAGWDSAWAAVPGFTHRQIFWDIFHVFHLGTARDLLGSMLYDLDSDGLLGDGPTFEARASQLWKSMAAWRKLAGITLKSGHVGKMRQSRQEYPELPKKLKGMQIQAMTFYVAHLTKETNDGSRQRSLRAACMYGIAAFLNLLWSSLSRGKILTETEAEAANFYGTLHVHAYLELAAASEAKREHLYKVRPKLHYMMHIIDRLEVDRVNPLSVATICDEDFMGKLKQIGRRCHATSMLERVILRRSIFLRLRWRRRRRTGLWLMRT